MSNIGELLTEKMGPLPRWGWVALGGGAGVAYYLYKKKAAPAAATPDLASAGSAGSSYWGNVGGGGGGGTDTTTPPPTQTQGPGVGGVVPPAGGEGYPAGDTNPSTWTNGVSEAQGLKNGGYTLGQALGGGLYGATGPSGETGLFDTTPGFGSPWGEFISGGGPGTSLLYGGQQYNQTPYGFVAGPSTPYVAYLNGVTGIPGLYNSASPSGWQSPSVNPPNSSVPGGGLATVGSPGGGAGGGTPGGTGTGSPTINNPGGQ